MVNPELVGMGRDLHCYLQGLLMGTKDVRPFRCFFRVNSRSFAVHKCVLHR